MPHDWSNIVDLSSLRDRREGDFEQAASGGEDFAVSDEPFSKAEDREHVRAIVSCLDYLYGEILKCDHRMAAHLVGAASECLRQRVQSSGEGK